MKKILLILTLIFNSTLAEAATYYISQSTGSDANPGTIGSPLKTADAIDGANFLTCGDTVLVKAGDVWEGLEAVNFGRIDSTCTQEGQWIKFNRYGSGANPIISGNSAYGGSWTNSSGAVYYASSITWTPVYTVGVNSYTSNGYVLWESDSIAHLVAGSFYFDDAANRVYVWLADSSDPTSSSIYIGRYPSVSADGLLNPSVDYLGSWVKNREGFSFQNFQVLNSNYYGTHNTGPRNTYSKIKYAFSGNEGFISTTFETWHGTHVTIKDSEVAWNTARGNGSGQGLTINTPYALVLRNHVHHNGMAGIDILNYSATNTDARYGIIAMNDVHDNSQWPGASFSDANFDPGIYCDGCQYTLFYGNKSYNNGLVNGTNASPGMRLYTENPTQRIAHSNIVINNLFYGNSSLALNWSTPDGYPSIGNIGMGNTLVGNGSVPAFQLDINQTGTGGDISWFYNIIDDAAGVSNVVNINYEGITADYNIYYGSGSTTVFNDYTNGSGGASRSIANIISLYGEETNSVFDNPDFVSRVTPNLHLDPASPAINFSNGAKWDTLSSYIINIIGPNEPRGSTLVSDVKDTGNADNGYHFNSALTEIGVTIS